MTGKQIKVGGLYRAKVSGNLTIVRVDGIRETRKYRSGKLADTVVYDVTNTRTGRTTTFSSAAKFRSEVTPTV